MKEMLVQILTFWNNYWGKSLFPYLLLLSVLYLLIFKRKNKNTRYILTYFFITLFLFFCPFTAKVIQTCIGESVYWRVLWLLPTTPVIAFAMTEFLKAGKGIRRLILTVLCIGMVAVSGQEFYQAGYYSFVHNYQQVPDEVPGICELIHQDANTDEYFLATDEDICPYIRVYDPSIYMMVGHAKRNTRGGAKKLYAQLNAPNLDYKELAHIGKRLRCNYLAVKIPNEEQKEMMEQYKYHEIGVIGRYSVFRLGDAADSYRSTLLDQVAENEANSNE